MARTVARHDWCLRDLLTQGNAQGGTGIGKVRHHRGDGWFNFESYEVSSWDGATAVLTQRADLPYNSGLAASITLVVDGAQSVPRGDGGEIFTAGTLTRIVWNDAGGGQIAAFSQLSVDWPQIPWLFDTNPSALDNLVLAGGHRFVGFDGQNGDTTYNEIRTGAGNDTVLAGSSDYDFIIDGGGADSYDGGAGIGDEISYNTGAALPAYPVFQGIVADLAAGTIVGPDGYTDTVTGIERIRGTFLADTMLGDGADNRFTGLRGRDVFDGRGGFDEVRYDRDARDGGTLGIVAKLQQGTVRDGFGNIDTLTSIEAVRGSDYNDRISDSNKNNRLDGRGGDDQFVITRGDDVIRGGSGIDSFVFKGRNFGDNRIDDFLAGLEVIQIQRAKNFGQLTLTDEAGGVLVSHAQGTIFLSGLTVDQLDAADFGF
jgi:Ca2+-binding RTX toxin-like protein